MQRLVAEVAARDVDPERKRQAGLEQPPLAEVDGRFEAVLLVGELTLVDEEARVRPAGLDLVHDLVERDFAEPVLAAEVEAEDEERRRHPPGHGDLDLA